MSLCIELGEGRIRTCAPVHVELPQGLVGGRDEGVGALGTLETEGGGKGAAFMLASPDPRVSEPEGGKEVDRGLVVGVVLDGDADTHVIRGVLGVLGSHCKVLVVGENVCSAV